MRLRLTGCGLLFVAALAVTPSAHAIQAPSAPCASRVPAADAPGAAAAALSLHDVLMQALHDDPSIAAGRLDAAASGDGVDAARARYFPVVSLSGSGGRTARSDLTAPGAPSRTLDMDQGELDVTQTVFDGQKTRYGVDEARGRELQDKNRLRKAINERLLSILDAFQNLRVERLRLAESQASRDQLDKLVSITAARVDAGQGSLVDLRRAQARFIEAKRTVEDSSASCQQVRQQFERLTNVPAAQVADAGPAFTPLSDQEMRRLSDLCATQCIDLTDSRLQLDRGRAEVGMQRAEGMPTVSVQATVSAFRNADGMLDHYRDRSIAVKLNWTLFSGGEYSARMSQVQRNVAALEARVDEARRKAGQDFAVGEVQYDNALESYDLAVAGTAVARQARALAERAYVAGLRGTIELADTIADESRYVNNMLSLDAKRFVAMYTLYSTVGDLPRLLGLSEE